MIEQPDELTFSVYGSPHNITAFTVALEEPLASRDWRVGDTVPPLRVTSVTRKQVER